LKENGCSINVLTASPHEIVDVCMNRLGITELFEHVWTCEDMGMKKSETGIYEKAADLLGKNVEEVVFFDDNIISLSTAKKAGMQTVGVYDIAGIEFEWEMKETGDRYIYSFRELEE
jgi:FMN phosphatase YigB (HAD superfamily)